MLDIDHLDHTTLDFASAILTGLSQPQKVIPARYLYDERGSHLFEDITRLAEYYPTRAENAVLARHAGAIADAAGRGRALVEFGSGSSTKTREIVRHAAPSAYVPVDISGDFLAEAACAFARAHPGLRVLPLVADFTQPLELPEEIDGEDRLGFFPGSTIGNFSPADAVSLLRTFRAALGDDARLVIGFDLCRDPAKLVPAYDDAQGVTAAFDLNLLGRINRELEGTIPIDAFSHRAVWNEAAGRVEMHLVAGRAVSFHAAGREFHMRAGEYIHTENSYKYRASETVLLARAGLWEPVADWQDEPTGFSVQVWRAPPAVMEP